MNTSLYDTELPIRSEIISTQSAALEHWASPGTWLTAVERTAVVEEVRRARDTRNKPLESAHLPGLHDRSPRSVLTSI